jgi:hypothetical protein
LAIKMKKSRRPRIVVIARGHAGLESAKDDVEHLGGSAFVLSVDVADAKAVELR